MAVLQQKINQKELHNKVNNGRDRVKEAFIQLEVKPGKNE